MDYDYTELEMRLRADCEKGFVIGPKTPLEEGSHPSFAPTGESFIELINPDMKLLANDQECYDKALAAFREYAKDRRGMLYWRTYPEIDRGRFYMRLLISAAPIAIPQDMSYRSHH